MIRLIKKNKYIFPYLLTAIILIIAFFWFKNNWSDINSNITFQKKYFLLSIPVCILSILNIGYIYQVIVKYLNLKLKFLQWASLTFAGMFANYVLPMRAGIAIRAAYFKKCHNFPVSKFASLMAFLYLITLFTNACAGILVLLLLGTINTFAEWAILTAFLIIAIACIWVILFWPAGKVVSDAGRVKNIIENIHSGFDILRNSKSLFFKSTLLSILNILLYSLRLYISFRAVGYEIEYSKCVLAGSFAAVAMFISITPASLGIREIAIWLACSVTGIAPEISIVAGSVDRMVSLLVVSVLGSLGLVKITHETSLSLKKQATDLGKGESNDES